MKIRILGCGGSFGVPIIGNKFGNCDSKNIKNYRTRPSVLVYFKNKNILIDTSPDLRMQLLTAKCSKINAVLYTHTHADHVHGINDLRAISMIMKSKISAWGSYETINYLKDNFSYLFQTSDLYKPVISLNPISDSFSIDDINIISFVHNHGKVDCSTYRIGNFAYTTDIKKFYEGSLEKLKNLDVWVISCLRIESHPSHASFNEIIQYINYVNPKKAYLTHLTAFMDYEEILKICPSNVEPAYDNLEIEISEK